MDKAKTELLLNNAKDGHQIDVFIDSQVKKIWINKNKRKEYRKGISTLQFIENVAPVFLFTSKKWLRMN